MSDSLENLYRQHRQGLYSFALSITGSSQLAEDAIQNAFEGFYRKGINGRLEQNGFSRNGHARNGDVRTSTEVDVVPYVFRSVKNAAIDLCRSNQRRQALSEVLFETQQKRTELPDEALLKNERNEILRQAIDSLPENDREAIVLKTFAGLTFEQAGQAVGTSPKTIATRYRRALEKLEQHLKGKL